MRFIDGAMSLRPAKVDVRAEALNARNEGLMHNLFVGSESGGIACIKGCP